MKTIALIVAGGESKRFGGKIPKQFRHVFGKPLLSWTIQKFEQAATIDQIVVVVAEDYLLYTSEKVVDPYNFRKVFKIVKGGATRRESVSNGLEALPLSTNYVAIHDGARPLILPSDIDRVVTTAIAEKAAIVAVKTVDTIKRVKDDFIIATLERSNLYQAQTPQVFQYDLIIAAHRDFEKSKNNKSITDDASLIEQKGFKIKVVESEVPNFKITSKSDLKLAEALLKEEYDN